MDAEFLKITFAIFISGVCKIFVWNCNNKLWYVNLPICQCVLLPAKGPIEQWQITMSIALWVALKALDLCNVGAQIIDLMLLVVDITKGVQTQTAECLIIGEITCDKMIVVLNKIDLVEPAKRASTVDRVSCTFFLF